MYLEAANLNIIITKLNIITEYKCDRKELR